MTKKLGCVGVATIGLLLPLTIQATSIEINHDIDASWFPGGTAFGVVSSAVPDVTVTVGDRVSLGFSFGDRFLRIDNDIGGEVAQIWPWLFYPESATNFVISDVTVLFALLDGTVLQFSYETITGSGMLGPVQGLGFGQFDVKSVRSIFTVSDLVDPASNTSLQQQTYLGYLFYAWGDSVQALRAVPEPGTLALLTLGLAGIGLGLRRKAN